MNTRIQKANGPELVFDRCARAGIACLIAVGLLLITAGTPGELGVVREAIAAVTAQAEEDGYRQGYFPAQFPAPQGEAQPHIEAF
jgi:hypothetical protein